MHRNNTPKTTTVDVTPEAWLDLSDAADHLGVHFTTLRRWVDAGKVPCIRTPGGRRRFRLSELAIFLASLREGELDLAASHAPSTALTAISQVKHPSVVKESWYCKLDEPRRNAMRQEGQRLMVVLMQYVTRSTGGEVFLEEGKRMASFYGEACYAASFSLIETARAFMAMRRSIMDSAYQVGALAGSPDADTWRLYDRMNTFLDTMLLTTLESYEQLEKRSASSPS